MNRIIWMGIGVAIGVIAFRKVTEAQSALGPEGLNRAVGRLADGLFDFADAVRDGMGERESELRTALGIDDGNGYCCRRRCRPPGCGPALAGRELVSTVPVTGAPARRSPRDGHQIDGPGSVPVLSLSRAAQTRAT